MGTPFVRRLIVGAAALALVVAAAPGATAQERPTSPTRRPPSRAMSEVFASPTGQTNSDIAFWGNHAYVGNYAGFRIFDISGPVPQLVSDFACFGPQNDVSVWDRDGNGAADLLFASVDRTLTGPRCGATVTAHDDPTGWEGFRIFDVSDPRAPAQIGAVYQDCGSHTHTLIPDPARNRVLLLNSSYPLRPGPTCGPVRGPAVGRHPHHGVVQVVQVPLASPQAASELTELPINYPGDPDNVFNPAQHELPGFLSLRACHDISVFVEAGLVAAACAEQAQLWRLDRSTMLPDTANPIWVFDDSTDTDGPGGGDSAVDFWHSATFTWDAKIVNFSDEAFGLGCPPVTAISESGTPVPSDTGRTHFLDVASGTRLSTFMISRPEPGDDAYCSTHQGNVIPAHGRYLLAQAWYMGGVDIIDFTSVRNPREIAYFDAPPPGAEGSDNWSHYWYEQDPRPGSPVRTYGQDGVHSPPTGRGFQAFDSRVGVGRRAGLDHLNPQTQERIIPLISRPQRTSAASDGAMVARPARGRR